MIIYRFSSLFYKCGDDISEYRLMLDKELYLLSLFIYFSLFATFHYLFVLFAVFHLLFVPLPTFVYLFVTQRLLLPGSLLY